MIPLSIYRLMLLAYPRQFRRDYANEMQRLFREQLEEARKPGRPKRVKHFYRVIVRDWLQSVVRERVDSIKALAQNIRNAGPRGAINEWIVTILMYLFASTTLVQAYVIPTGSMEGNLRVGDHMLVDKTAYGRTGSLGRFIMPYREIKRGDIVAFLYPEDTKQTFVKRVIGLAGDRIRFEGSDVIRNGKKLIEPYTQHIAGSTQQFSMAPGLLTTPRGRSMLEHNVVNGEIVVPPDSFFMMGDNRDNSLDSRYWGFAPRENVVGKPLFVYWSFDAPTEDLTTWNLAHLADVAEHFLTKTRWERTFLIPRPQEAKEE